MTSNPYFKHHVFFCTNERDDGAKCCGASGGQEMRDYLKKKIKKLNLNGEGKCRINYVDEEDIDEILCEHLQHGRIVERLKI